jgi:hypothetical protein
VLKEEEAPPTSLHWSHRMEDEMRCGGGSSFSSPGMREEQCSLREKRNTYSGLGHASSRALNAC